MLGPYRIDAVLGEGGMGQVFKAERADGTGGVVALKVMKQKFAADATHSRRFLREARAAAEVHNPHLVGVLDFGEEQGRQYLAMRYIDGESLEQRIEREKTLDIGEIIRIAGEVGAGLDALHREGLIHRDVKSANVMLDKDGVASLTDFGLAKGEGYSVLTKPGQVMGTLDYLAPELIRGEPASPKSDIYALACVVFEALCGQPPFGGKSIFQVGMAVLEDEPPDPCADRSDAPPELTPMVKKGLAKDPDARPPTATAFANLLRMAYAPPTQ